MLSPCQLGYLLYHYRTGSRMAYAILPGLDSSHYLMGLLTVSVSLALTLPTTVPTAAFSGSFHSQTGERKTGGSSSSFTMTFTVVLSVNSSKLRKRVSTWSLTASAVMSKRLLTSKSKGCEGRKYSTFYSLYQNRGCYKKNKKKHNLSQLNNQTATTFEKQRKLYVKPMIFLRRAGHDCDWMLNLFSQCQYATSCEYALK